MGTINPAYQILQGSALRDTPFACQNLPVCEWVSASNNNNSTASLGWPEPRDKTIMHMAAIQGRCNVFEKDSVIRGHNIYKKSWMPVVGKELTPITEEGNEHDQYTVTIRIGRMTTLLDTCNVCCQGYPVNGDPSLNRDPTSIKWLIKLPPAAKWGQALLGGGLY